MLTIFEWEFFAHSRFPGRIGAKEQADISLAERHLRYKPLVNFEEGLRRTVAWYQESRQLKAAGR